MYNVSFYKLKTEEINIFMTVLILLFIQKTKSQTKVFNPELWTHSQPQPLSLLNTVSLMAL